MSDTAIPRFNHIAISVPEERVSSEGSAELLAFYSEVFGWTEMPTMNRPNELLVLRVHSNEQFVYLHADPEPMRCPTTDHFGLSVTTPDQLDAVLERAKKFQEGDARVEISERRTEDFKVLLLHNVYIRYLLPMTIELQCFEWQGGAGPASLPEE